MVNTRIAVEIQTRINELKSEQVQLRTFIDSDVARREALEKAIEELNWVLELVTGGKDESA
ncbi:MAG: hypothetical protein GX331_05055 [Firmicutes bacterium]|jgi:hypothetical protein|nr:hypothetical protein [Bacillota bacterium]